jgi:hypothetical protein
MISFTIAAAALAASSGAIETKPCDGLSGVARRECLEGEVRRGREETARIEERNRRLDMGQQAACVAREVGAHASGRAAGVAGRATWEVATRATDRALNNSRPCTPRAR